MVRHSPIRRHSPRKIVFVDEPIDQCDGGIADIPTPLKAAIVTSNLNAVLPHQPIQQTPSSLESLHIQKAVVPFHIDDGYYNESIDRCDETTQSVMFFCLVASVILYAIMCFVFGPFFT